MDERQLRIPEADMRSPWQIEADEAKAHYQSGGGRAENRGYQGEERRSWQSRLDREIPVIVGMKMSSNESTEASELVNYFQDFGPMTWQEGRALYRGAAKSVDIAANTKKGDPEAAVKDRYYTYAGYLLAAASDKDTLDNVTVHRDGEGLVPDIERLRNSPEALDVIARHFMTRGFLWDKRGKYWPSKTSELYQERHKYWLGFVLSAAEHASDDSMATLFNFANGRADKLVREWWGQMQQVEALPLIKKMEAEDKIIPISFTRLWAHKARQLELGPSINEANVPAPPTNYDDLLLPQVKREIDEKRQMEEEAAAWAEAEYDREMEKAQQRMAPAEARKELQGKGIGRLLLRGERFEQDYQKEIEEISERAQKPKQKKKKRKARNGRNAPSLRPWIRRQPGYDKRPPEDDLSLF